MKNSDRKIATEMGTSLDEMDLAVQVIRHFHLISVEKTTNMKMMLTGQIRQFLTRNELPCWRT